MLPGSGRCSRGCDRRSPPSPRHFESASSVYPGALTNRAGITPNFGRLLADPPVDPPRSRSAWPLCPEYSSTMCTSTSRSEKVPCRLLSAWARRRPIPHSTGCLTGGTRARVRVMSRDEIVPTYRIPHLVRAVSGSVGPAGLEPETTDYEFGVLELCLARERFANPLLVVGSAGEQAIDCESRVGASNLRIVNDCEGFDLAQAICRQQSEHCSRRRSSCRQSGSWGSPRQDLGSVTPAYCP
jgi:hypothetical protein